MENNNFIWIIQDSNEKHYNWTELYKAVIELNSYAEYIKLDEIENFVPPSVSKPIIIGGDDFIERAIRNPLIKEGIYSNISFFRVDTYVDLFGNRYLNSDTKYVSINELMSIENFDFFARPLYDNKCFNGGVIYDYNQIKKIFSHCKNCSHFGENCICISSIKSISAEWRAVIINGKISDICCYSPANIHRNAPAFLTDFCQKCIIEAPNLKAWVIDIAESNGDYYVLECNIFNASNFYNCNRYKIVKDLEKAFLNKALPKKNITLKKPDL